MIIGLTGGSGSGKSTLGKAAADLGYYVIDADKVGHAILLKGNEAYNEVVEAFGEGILSEDGEIDRKKLGAIVFSDSQKLMLLNKITHDKISKAIENMIKVCENSMVVVDAAVLFESGMDKKCDFVIAILSSIEERAARICEREGISYDKAMARIKSQKDNAYYAERADKTIYNYGSIKQLYRDGLSIFREVANGKI